jgi:hypothetical protein
MATFFAPLDRMRGRVRDDGGKLSFQVTHGLEKPVQERLELAGARLQMKEDTTLNPLAAFRRAGRAPGAVDWAAFAYAGLGPRVELETDGPGELSIPALRGVLSFGRLASNSAWLGKFLLTLDYDRARAFQQASRADTPEDKERFDARGRAMDDALDRMQRAFSRLLERSVKIEFPIDSRVPRILFDGEDIPVARLGDGMRRTFSWVADLLVRLQRIRWQDTSRSPLEQDFWLLLDEVDESMHPTMQLRLLPALRELFPNARLYVATHSPFLVASVGEGIVFPIRPHARTHRVNGTVQPIQLKPGLSLEWVIEQVFETPANFVDAPTLEHLANHKQAIDDLRAKRQIDWKSFLSTRDWLLALNIDEVNSIVLFREAPVRAEIQEQVKADTSATV